MDSPVLLPLPLLVVMRPPAAVAAAPAGAKCWWTGDAGIGIATSLSYISAGGRARPNTTSKGIPPPLRAAAAAVVEAVAAESSVVVVRDAPVADVDSAALLLPLLDDEDTSPWGGVADASADKACAASL